MPSSSKTPTPYRTFLRSRWPSRTRLLAIYAFGGSLTLWALDWAFTRRQTPPPSLATLAAARLPWVVIPLAGELLRRRAPGWRLFPQAIIALSVVWAWGNVTCYFAIGLGGTVLQAITLFACLVTAAALMPLTLAGRVGVISLMAFGYVSFDLLWPRAVPIEVRLADDLVVVAFAVLQVVVFQQFAAAQRKGVVLRYRLERAVADLSASRQRAGEAVAAIGRLAGTVAHEVNNPLAAVKVNVHWLATEGVEPAQAAERAEVVLESMQAIDRIAAIVQELKHRSVEQDERLHQEDASAGARGAADEA